MDKGNKATKGNKNTGVEKVDSFTREKEFQGSQTCRTIKIWPLHVQESGFHGSGNACELQSDVGR